MHKKSSKNFKNLYTLYIDISYKVCYNGITIKQGTPSREASNPSLTAYTQAKPFVKVHKNFLKVCAICILTDLARYAIL